MEKRITFLIVFFLTYSLTSDAQKGLVMGRIDQSNGLSNGTVPKVLQDDLGFIWMATQNGLNRYDGSRFKIFNTSNSEIPSNDLTNIFIDSNSKIWISTYGGGMSIYDINQDVFTNYKYDANDSTSISSNEVNTVFETKDGTIWVGTENALNRFSSDNGSFTKYHIKKKDPQSVSHNNVHAIHQDHNKNLWIGTFGGGLNLFDTHLQKFVPINAKNSGSPFIHAIDSLDKNTLLIGSAGNGLLTFNTSSKTFSPYGKSPFENVKIIRSIAYDSNRNLWVGTDGEGLIKISDPNKEASIVQYVNNPDIQTSLISNAIYSIFEDKSLNLWIGTAWNGISIIERNAKKQDFYFSDFKKPNQTGVLSIYEENGILLFGTDGIGLTSYDTNKKHTLTYKDLGGEYYQFIKRDHNKGKLWFGTFKNGLISLDANGHCTKFQHNALDSNSISRNDVRDILFLNENEYLISTWGGGLNRFNLKNNTFSSFKHDSNDPTSISSNNVNVLLDAGNGKVWVSTFGGGLNLFDTSAETFTRYMHDAKNKNSLSGNKISSLHSDSDNNLWIGTWGNGLTYFDIKNNTFTRVDVTDGLIDNITTMLEDDGGNLWFSTKQGITRFSPSTFESTAFPELKGQYHRNSAFKDKNGRFYFGNSKGVVSFDPNSYKSDVLQANIQFTDIKLFNESILSDSSLVHKKDNILSNIVLSHDQNVLSIAFAALHYPFSEMYEYAVKLDNFSNEWIKLGKQRSVNFSNLSPGDYYFSVKATNSKNWDIEPSIGFNVTIQKPWWATWWAYTCYVSIVIALLYLFRRFVVTWETMKSNLKFEKISHEREKEIHDLKLRFFTNISHEIRTPITLMLGSINRIEENGVLETTQRKPFNTLRKNGNHLLQLLNELLDFRKLETDNFTLKVSEGNFVTFSKEIFLSFNVSTSEKNIDYQFHSELETIMLWYDKEQMEKVLYNLLSNAFKYTEFNGTVQLSLEQNDENVFVRVKNSGLGIAEEHIKNIFRRFYQVENLTPSNEQGAGLGLSITKDIVNLHSGEISVESMKNVGTEIVIKLPLGNGHFSPQEFAILSDEVVPKDSCPVQKQNIVDTELTTLVSAKDQKILVVDDNIELREYITNILESQFTVLQAANGIEALTILDKEIPDLIVSDVLMPEMDGIELTKQIKSNMKTSHIPVILLTARTSLIYKKEGYDNGADEYITKPFNEVLLKSRIKSILENRQLLNEKIKNELITLPKQLAINTPDQQFLEDLMNVIEKNINSSELRAEFISGELAMSHSVVYKKIKALTGLSLVEFVRDFKLKRAAQLMTTSKFNISDACYTVGFSDRKYFSSIFKNKFGMTPSDYIRSRVN